MEAKHKIIVGVSNCSDAVKVVEDCFLSVSCKLIFQTPQVGFPISQNVEVARQENPLFMCITEHAHSAIGVYIFKQLLG